MTKIQRFEKNFLVIGNWRLFDVCNLGFGKVNSKL